ncbi:DUF3828 domain-containing protein [Herbaspirillum sp.]|uniref:DUF3828 domain-containing protein n=1 Tax=Herbaspirillum sp. TaxID=1890675 RepID=UPI001AFE5D12|nr:DUF3828 domain-containing protein [Herbaspirillum sp.]MBO9537945.1 DUF3828 domain-containing protein [Herbaspirillum sp.]
MTRLLRSNLTSSHTRHRLLTGACMLAVALGLGGCNNFSGEEQQQAEAVGAFYRIHLKTNTPGLPPADELRQYQPLLSRALYALLAQAETADARYHATAGSQAPPIIEGDLFTSLYEGATSFSVQSCDTGDQERSQRASCQVAFQYKKDGAEEAWNDKILLVREDNRWRIDDIEFIGNDQSSQREYLTDTLADAIKEAE